MKNQIIITAQGHKGTLERLENEFSAIKLWEAADRDAALKSAANVRALAHFGHSKVDGKLMDALPKLELISNFGVGVDQIDLEAAKKRKITVTNTPDVLTEEVADLALALVLAAVRKVPQGDKFVRDGKWLKGAMPLTESVQGKTCGIIGMGRIGRAIAKRAQAFNLKIAYQGPNKKNDVSWAYFNDPVELAREADIVVVACPGGEATRGLVTRAVIEALGPKGTIVNISRGTVIDEPAMLEALQSGKLGAAGLDVFADEPRVPEGFLALDNVVLQPHVGSATHQTRKEMGQVVIDNLAAHFAGKPLVTPI